MAASRRRHRLGSSLVSVGSAVMVPVVRMIEPPAPLGAASDVAGAGAEPVPPPTEGVLPLSSSSLWPVARVCDPWHDGTMSDQVPLGESQSVSARASTDSTRVGLASSSARSCVPRPVRGCGARRVVQLQPPKRPPQHGGLVVELVPSLGRRLGRSSTCLLLGEAATRHRRRPRVRDRPAGGIDRPCGDRLRLATAGPLGPIGVGFPSRRRWR